MDNRDAMERLSRIGVRLDEGAYMPERAHASDAGLDLRTPDNFVLSPHSHVVIDTGVTEEVMKEYASELKKLAADEEFKKPDFLKNPPEDPVLGKILKYSRPEERE